MIADIQSALDAIEKNHATRVGIITGAGKAFCAGMDLDKLAAARHANSRRKSGRFPPHGPNLAPHLVLPSPNIAAVNGAAYAGGCGIATLCDFTFAVPEAEFGYTEVKIGFLPAIVSVFLTRQIGEKRSRDLLLTGRIITAPKPAKSAWSPKSSPPIVHQRAPTNSQQRSSPPAPTASPAPNIC